MAQKTEAQLMTGLMADLKRAAELGLIPTDGAKISARGEFIVNPSNIEEDENKKMRTYRYKPFPKAVHGWGVNPEAPAAGAGPLMIVVNNPAELENALTAGWSLDPVSGPAGALGAMQEPSPATEPEVVRTFTAPGQLQPHEAVVTRPAPKTKRGRKPGTKTTKQVN